MADQNDAARAAAALMNMRIVRMFGTSGMQHFRTQFYTGAYEDIGNVVLPTLDFQGTLTRPQLHIVLAHMQAQPETRALLALPGNALRNVWLPVTMRWAQLLLATVQRVRVEMPTAIEIPDNPTEDIYNPYDEDEDGNPRPPMRRSRAPSEAPSDEPVGDRRRQRDEDNDDDDGPLFVLPPPTPPPPERVRFREPGAGEGAVNQRDAQSDDDETAASLRAGLATMDITGEPPDTVTDANAEVIWPAADSQSDSDVQPVLESNYETDRPRRVGRSRMSMDPDPDVAPSRSTRAVPGWRPWGEWENSAEGQRILAQGAEYRERMRRLEAQEAQAPPPIEPLPGYWNENDRNDPLNDPAENLLRERRLAPYTLYDDAVRGGFYSPAQMEEMRAMRRRQELRDLLMDPTSPVVAAPMPFRHFTVDPQQVQLTAFDRGNFNQTPFGTMMAEFNETRTPDEARQFFLREARDLIEEYQRNGRTRLDPVIPHFAELARIGDAPSIASMLALGLAARSRSPDAIVELGVPENAST